MTELLRKNILFLRVLSFCQFTATQFQKRYWELGTHKGAHLQSRLIEKYLPSDITVSRRSAPGVSAFLWAETLCQTLRHLYPPHNNPSASDIHR